VLVSSSGLVVTGVASLVGSKYAFYDWVSDRSRVSLERESLNVGFAPGLVCRVLSRHVHAIRLRGSTPFFPRRAVDMRL
jgi:hypothetical protein